MRGIGRTRRGEGASVANGDLRPLVPELGGGHIAVRPKLPIGPFVLLDDARNLDAAPARLYANPIEIVVARTAEDVAPALVQISKSGYHAAGYVAYEAGLALEPKLPPTSLESGAPLLWFGMFESCTEISPGEVAALLPDPASGWAGEPRPDLGRESYASALGRVAEYIAAGDIYQANFTFQCKVSTAGHPLAVYAGLRERAKAGYGGVVWTGSDWFLSMSPELFFALRSGKITTKPMKGTAPRENDAVADAAIISNLQSDPKQRAENLMIVDLLRNDLSRVAKAGSVEVPHLFTVESYPTVHTMTSTVTAQVRTGLDVGDILNAIYPCGSITGAPKIRAMEIISEVEAAQRGVYTGSIGRIDPDGDAAFNVAIRTLHLRDGQGEARLGLGSGIVADSKMGEEWRECLAKGKFVSDRRMFDLIETMRFDPESGIARLDGHLARMKESARALDFEFDRHAARNELQVATFRLDTTRRIRLMLSRTGSVAIEIGPLLERPAERVDVAIVPLPVASSDFRLCHKTSDRRFYDQTRQASGKFEVIFHDEQGFLTEGSFTNVFVERDGQLLTPPLSRGLLPGVLRMELIAEGRAIEADLRREDLIDGLLLGNSSRGLFAARL